MPRWIRRFELHERIGLGGMAEVFRATAWGAEGDSRTLVVKKILPRLSADPTWQKMFHDEARVIARLDHPNVVKLLDSGRIDESLFLALEYVAGTDLAVLARAFRGQGKRIPLETALFVTSEILEALGYAHDRSAEDGTPLKIVHRDLSPSNILLSHDGDVKLTDFGIAKAAERVSETTRAGTLKGNVHYMAPEQITGRDLDHRADLYGLGMVLYTIIAGRNPFEGEDIAQTIYRIIAGSLPSLSALNPGTPPELERIVSRATKLIPALRFSSAAEFRGEVRAFAASAGLKLDGRCVARDLAEAVGLPGRAPSVVPSIVVRLAPMIAESVGGGDESVFRTAPAEEPRRSADDTTAKVTLARPPEPEPEPGPERERDTADPAGVVIARLRTTPSHPAGVDEDVSHMIDGGRDRDTAPPFGGSAIAARLPADDTVKILIARRAVPSSSLPIQSPDAVLEGHRFPVTCVAIGGDTIVTGSHDETLRVWSLAERASRAVLRGHRAQVEAVAVSTDGLRAVSGARDGSLVLWDVRSGEVVRRFRGHADRIFSVALSADGTRILSGGNDRMLMLWSVDEERPIGAIGGHRDTVTSVAFFSDGVRAVSGSYDATIRVWDLDSALPMDEIDTLEESVRAVAPSSDGRLFLSASADGAVRLWDVEHSVPLHTYAGHGAPVVSVAFAADAKRAVSASFDGTLRLWDVLGGTARCVFVGHAGAVFSATFTPRGDGVVSTGADGTVRIWSVPQ